MRQGTECAHVASLRDKAEDAVVLLVEGTHVCRGLALRGDELARECLLCDLRQVAEAKTGITAISIPMRRRRE